MAQAVDELQAAVADMGPTPRRSSIEKPPLLADSGFDDVDEDTLPTAFDRLPDEIIQQ